MVTVLQYYFFRWYFSSSMLWVNIVLCPVNFMLTIVVYLLVVVATKWVLVGRVHAGTHAMYNSGFHLRWCLKNKLFTSRVTLTVMDLIQDTPAIVWFYRALGAKIGSGVSLDLGQLGLFYPAAAKILDPDLIRIDDGTRIETSTLSTHAY